MRHSKITVLPIRRPENGRQLEEILDRIPSVFGQIVCLAKGFPLISRTAKRVPSSVVRELVRKTMISLVPRPSAPNDLLVSMNNLRDALLGRNR